MGRRKHSGWLRSRQGQFMHMQNQKELLFYIRKRGSLLSVLEILCLQLRFHLPLPSGMR